MFGTNNGGVFRHFRAGRMTYSNGVVSPDARRGDLSFSEAPNAVEMVWTCHATRTTIMLPKGKTKVSFVEKCKSGRILLFEVSDGGAPTLHFFWLQDKSTVDDAEHLSVLTNALKASEPEVKMSDFVKIMQRIDAKKESPSADCSLEKVLFSSHCMNAINNDTQFFTEKLGEFLPEDKNATLMQQVKNPQVKAAIKALEETLKDPSGFNEMCRTYGLPESKKIGVFSFINLILSQSKKQ